jgi:hypothetical protein
MTGLAALFANLQKHSRTGLVLARIWTTFIFSIDYNAHAREADTLPPASYVPRCGSERRNFRLAARAGSISYRLAEWRMCRRSIRNASLLATRAALCHAFYQLVDARGGPIPDYPGMIVTRMVNEAGPTEMLKLILCIVPSSDVTTVGSSAPLLFGGTRDNSRPRALNQQIWDCGQNMLDVPNTSGGNAVGDPVSREHSSH